MKPLVRPMAEALSALGVQGAVVVHGHGGVDELSLSGPNVVAVLRHGRITEERVSPEDVGLSRSPLEALRGGEARENAGVLRGVLAGRPGPQRDAVVFNAAAALVAAGVERSWKEAAVRAQGSIDSGRAAEVLRRLSDFSEEERQRRRLGDPCCGGGAVALVSPDYRAFCPLVGVSA